MEIDKYLYIFINSRLSNGFFDIIMPAISFLGNWAGIWIALGFFFMLRYKTFGFRGFIILMLSLGICFLLVDNFLKEAFARSRPFWDIPGARLLIEAPRDFSFPSGHAATSFAAALVLHWFYKGKSWAFFLVAAVVAFSRVYVGVHYPLDVLAGSVVGAICGFITIFLGTARV